MHTWHSRVPDVPKPDYMLIDLDPSEGNPWEHVREIAMVVKEVLDELKLPSYPKTSGVSGMHILTPIVIELPFPEVRRFAKAVAVEIANRVPKIATTTWVVKDRTGVFVDYGQNAFDRTIASAYSIRPMADARASAPLRWDEVPDVRPEAFTLKTMRDRVAKVGDLTADIWQHRADLKPLFKTLKLKDPVVDDRVLVRPSRAWTEEEQRAWRERPRTGGSGWNRGTSRRPPAAKPKEAPDS
jgi:DNA primase